MPRRFSEGARQRLSCTTNFAVVTKICRKKFDQKRLKLLDSEDRRPVRASVSAWYGARQVTTNLN